MSLSGDAWIDSFTKKSSVKDLCNTLDQTSESILNTTNSDIVKGFFSFGAYWGRAIYRTIDDSWNKRNRYSCLRYLWDDVSEKAGDIIQDKNVIDELEKFNLKKESINDYVRLTLALCAKTHQDAEANYAKISGPDGVIHEDKSSRSRWNEAIRTYAIRILENEEITIKENDQKVDIKWFDLLGKLENLRGKIGIFAKAPEGKIVWDKIITKVKPINDNDKQ